MVWLGWSSQSTEFAFVHRLTEIKFISLSRLLSGSCARFPSAGGHPGFGTKYAPKIQTATSRTPWSEGGSILHRGCSCHPGRTESSDSMSVVDPWWPETASHPDYPKTSCASVNANPHHMAASIPDGVVRAALMEDIRLIQSRS